MLNEWLSRVYLRDLDSLRDQINGYENEADLWKRLPGVSNTPGNLALHLAGNLQFYVGTQLGQTGYVRDRPAEFGTAGLPRAEVVRRIEETRAVMEKVLQGLDGRALEAEYPIEVGGVRISTGQFLVHLAVHLGYHLGQVDYHRRLLTSGSSLPGMQSIGALAEPA